MEMLSVQNMNFSYPKTSNQALHKINLQVNEGDFIVLCGPSGSGKSTLLRLLKQELELHGQKSGEIYYQKMPLQKHDPLKLAKEIGIVFQDPENQIVMNTVMEELLFGMENLGFSTNEMRKKLAEIVHYFGFNHLLHRTTSELSGGEKQQVNLASVLLLNPKILLLDEPTAQLDPIAAKDFMQLLKQLNDDFGITILIVEHRLDELFSLANRLVMLERGEINLDTTPRAAIQEIHPKMSAYLPQASQLYLAFMEKHNASFVPYNVKEAKQWLKEMKVDFNENKFDDTYIKHTLLELKTIDFSYSKFGKPILQDLSLTIQEGEWLAILGSNGTGKSTLLKIIAGLLKPQHGRINYKGKRVKKIEQKWIGYLPQDPKLFFLHETLEEEYEALGERYEISKAEVFEMIKKFNVEDLLKRHPYDLSGGELQRAALVGILLGKPELLLLDEPTKGIDPAFKIEFAEIIEEVRKSGVTVVMVTHDVEFAAQHVTRCSMMFQGDTVVTEATNKFFKENNYYTTMVNRISKDSHVPAVITVEEAKRNWLMKKELRSLV